MKHVKRFLPLALGAALFFLATGLECNPDARKDVLVAITITDQPEGGTNVNTVSCTFEATFSRTDGKTDPLLDDPVVVSSEWLSPHGSYNYQQHQLVFPGQTYGFTSTKSAPAGAHLDKPFWLRVVWYDSDGKNIVCSDTAHCE